VTRHFCGLYHISSLVSRACGEGLGGLGPEVYDTGLSV
jgi:hypothetical protein